MRRFGVAAVLVLVACTGPAPAEDPGDVKRFLAHEIIGPHRALAEVQDYVEPRVPRMPDVKNLAEWEQFAGRLRADMLSKVVFRGEAAAWRDAPAKVEWLEQVPGDPGHHLRQ